MTNVPVQTSLKENTTGLGANDWKSTLETEELEGCATYLDRIITGKTKKSKKFKNGGDTNEEGSDDTFCLYCRGSYSGTASGQVLTVRRIQVEGTQKMK